MLEAIYAMTEQGSTEAESVMDFAAMFVKSDEMEEMFYDAVRDSRLSGFRVGLKAALALLAEVR